MSNKETGRIDFYSSTSERSNLKIKGQETSQFYDRYRRESYMDDSDREEFKEPFDYSFLDEK